MACPACLLLELRVGHHLAVLLEEHGHVDGPRRVASSKLFGRPALMHAEQRCRKAGVPWTAGKCSSGMKCVPLGYLNPMLRCGIPAWQA